MQRDTKDRNRYAERYSRQISLQYTAQNSTLHNQTPTVTSAVLTAKPLPVNVTTVPPARDPL